MLLVVANRSCNVHTIYNIIRGDIDEHGRDSLVLKVESNPHPLSYWDQKLAQVRGGARDGVIINDSSNNSHKSRTPKVHLETKVMARVYHRSNL